MTGLTWPLACVWQGEGASTSEPGSIGIARKTPKLMHRPLVGLVDARQRGRPRYGHGLRVLNPP